MDAWIPAIARTGYAARGVVYLIVGAFAVLAALGRSEARGSEGALQALLSQPFGTGLVWLMVAGLAAFAFWRLIQAWRDTDDHGTDAKGLAIRAGLVGGAISYAALALVALGMVSSWGSDGQGGSGDPSAGWIGSAYDAGFGPLLLYAVVAVIAAVGVFHIIKGWRAGFEKYFRCPERTMRWVRPLSRFGLIARGVVFLILAALIFSGGLRYDEAGRPGLADALEAVQGYGFGWFILLVIALGLIAFGLYSLAEARYRRVTAH